MNRKKTTRLTYEHRYRIRELLDCKTSIAIIAKELGVSRTTIYNELNINSRSNGVYDPDYAQEQCQKRQKGKSRTPILKKSPEMAEYIAHKILDEHLSPETIESLIVADNERFPDQKISTGTIYNAISAGLIPGVTNESLIDRTTVMFSGGHLRLPAWAINQTGFKDGDRFTIDVTKEGQITFTRL